MPFLLLPVATMIACGVGWVYISYGAWGLSHDATEPLDRAASIVFLVVGASPYITIAVVPAVWALRTRSWRRSLVATTVAMPATLLAQRALLALVILIGVLRSALG